jgi:heat shock protein HslJ
VKPQDLDDRAPIEPSDELLANIHARSRSFRRHRTTQRLTSVTTGLLVLALAGGLAWTRIDATNGRVGPGTSASSTTTRAVPAITQSGIMGKWRPVSIVGYDGPLTKPPLGREPRLSFNGRDRWSGSDGCNDIGGTYRVDGSGVDLLTFGSTAVGCPSGHPDFEPIEGAARIELRNDQLVFSTSDGTVIARFERAGVTARIELPSTTMTAGSKMSGKVVVENNTGHVIPASGCGSLFAVLLGNAAIHPDPAWTMCLQPLPIPVGESSYPVMIWAAYQGCSTPAQGDLPACLAAGGPPPLPPGDYQARFFQSSPVVTPALPIDVKVVS